jgi:O-antigen ligase
MATLLSGFYGSILTRFGLGFVIYGLYLIFVLFSFRHILVSKYKTEDLWLLSLILLIYIAAIISVFYTPSAYVGKKLLNLSVSIYAFFAAKYIVEKTGIERIFKVWLIIALIMNLIILYVLWLVHFSDWLYGRFNGGMMPKYLMSAVYSYPPCLYFILKGTLKEKILSGFIILMQAYLGGRGPLIFFVFVLLAILINIRSRKTLYFTSAAVVLIIIIGFYFNIFSSLIGRLELFLNLRSESVRLDQYHQAFRSIIHHPVFGAGFNSSGILLYPGNDSEISYPHNIYLETWFESGIFSFISLVILSVYFYGNFFYYSAYKKEDIRLFILGVVCYYLLNGLKSNSYVDLRLMFFFMGLFVFLKNKHEVEPINFNAISSNNS